MDRRQILLLISEIEKMTGICKNQWQFKTKPARETLIFEKNTAAEMNTKWNKNV